MKKMILIGAGSMSFTQGLINDLMNFLGGTSAELALCDIDEHALSVVYGLAQKMIFTKGAAISLSCDTDRKKLLPGCDYVVSTIGVGGRRAWEQDVFIPRKYGVFQPVGDTAMPGGISRAMRMVPALLDIAKDVKKICPGALFFNYSNPMAVLTRAIMKVGEMPVIGLCHGVNGMEQYLSEVMGVTRSLLTARSVGINHMTFMYDIRDDGIDLKPRMHEYYAKQMQNGIDSGKTGRLWDQTNGQAASIVGEPFSWEMFELFDAFPAPGDRHITEFFTEYFPKGCYYGKTLGYDGGYSFERVIAMGDEQFQKTEQLALSDQPLPGDFFASMSGEHEQLMNIIDSIEHDRRRVFSANLPNRGAVPNLPYNAVLELPAAACAGGFHTLCCPDFPDILAAMVSRFLANIEVTVDAALTGDRKLFVESILIGGYITDRVQVEKMVDELLHAQGEYLPQF